MTRSLIILKGERVFKLIDKKVMVINGVTKINLKVKYDECDYEVKAEMNPVTKYWEQWGAPKVVLNKTTEIIQQIFRDKMLAKAKGIFHGLY